MQILKENLSFVLTVAAIFAGLAILARLAEKTICKNFMRPRNAKYIAVCAMCSALAGILMLLEIPVFFAPSFYKIDLSELPVLFCGFCLGPVAGVISEFIKVVIKLLLKGTSTAFVGDFANFAVGCALVLPASIIYHVKKTKKGAPSSAPLSTPFICCPSSPSSSECPWRPSSAWAAPSTPRSGASARWCCSPWSP